MSGPLSHIKVLDLSRVLAAPWAAQNLADLGADVSKVERPIKGDDSRAFAPPFLKDQDGNVTRESAYFCAANRGKKSITIDLSKPEGQQLVRELAKNVDVIFENYKVGDLARYGLGYEDIKAINPAIIYCSVTGFGQTGPEKDRPGYDPLMQAFGGIMSTTGEEGRPAVRVGASIVDMGTGLWAIIGILTALYERQTTGVGRVVDVSLFETATSWVSLLASHFLASGTVAQKQGSGATGIAPYKAYTTRDGEIVVAAGSDGLFKRLAHAVGHPEWVQDPRFVDNPSRVLHQVALYSMLDALLAEQDTQTWVSCFEEAGIPCSAVQNIAQMVAHPQTEALNLIQDVPGTGMRFFGLPVRFDGQRPQPTSAPPKLGEHQNQIFNPGETSR
jgi:crotonobetainyl-CoA:carnitine CoA-transferase CaiB-like acyl-CoA transferase